MWRARRRPGRQPATHPLLTDGWLHATLAGLVDRYDITFAAQWRADPDRLLDAALDPLAGLRVIATRGAWRSGAPAHGARYRNVVVEVRRRKSEPTLFDKL